MDKMKVRQYVSNAVGFVAKYIVLPVAIITALGFSGSCLKEGINSIRSMPPEGHGRCRTVLTYKDTDHNGLYDTLETSIFSDGQLTYDKSVPLGYEVTRQEIENHAMRSLLEEIIFEK